MNLNKTKIIATVGPACSSRSILSKLISSGVDVFRINFSHAKHEDVERIVSDIKNLRIKHNKHVSILGDLQGPKIRLGSVNENTSLNKGDAITLTTRLVKNGNNEKVSINYKDFAKDVKKGESVLIDDGKIILQVQKTDRVSDVELKVIQGGALSSNKGVNLPNTKISMPALTNKDIKDAKLAAKLGVDWIALSFVRSKNDVLQLKILIDKNSDHPIPVISKIEKPQAIKKIVKGLNSGLLNQTLKGVTGSGKTFAMANVIEHLQRPAIVMSHNKTLAAQLYGEFKEFFPDNAVEYFVSYYDYYQPEAYVPSSDVFIEKDASINEHIEQMRLSATKAVLERRDVIIVATVSAIYGLGDPKQYLDMVLHLSIKVRF